MNERHQMMFGSGRSSKRSLAGKTSNPNPLPPAIMRSTLASRKKERVGSTMFRQAEALTLVKKESQLIAKNPKRFLDNYAEGKVLPTPADTSSLTSIMAYLDDQKSENLLNQKADEFENKYQLSKTRTLLLNMTSANANAKLSAVKSKINSGLSTPSHNRSRPTTGMNSTPSSGKSRTSTIINKKSNYEHVRSRVASLRGSGRWAQSMQLPEEFPGGEEVDEGYFNNNLDKNNAEELDKAIQSFVDNIKTTDIDNIIIWINTLATLQDAQLPYGFPDGLKMPKITENMSDPDLRAFVEIGCDEFMLLDGEYNNKLEEIGKRLKENWEALQSSRWSPKDSALLFYIITALEESPNARFRAELIHKLFKQNEEHVALQKYRLRMKRAWEEKRGNIIKDWVRDKEELLQKINEGWDMVQQNLTKKRELAKERKDQLECCKYWRDQVERLRRIKQKRVRRIEVMVEPYEKAIEAREHARVDEELRKRRTQRLLLEQYKRDQMAKAVEERREKERLEMELEKNAKLQAKYNRSRVQTRQLAYEFKQEAQKELERLREEERLLRAQLLEQTKEKVEIDYDPANILADTHSSLIRRHEIQTLWENEEEIKMVKFFQERYGFSSERVLKDRRVRLESKLRDAGLIDSSYARQVLLAMEPKPKPHLKSNFEFKEDQ